METPEPTPGPDYPPPPAPRPSGRNWTIAGFVLAVVAIVIAPILFGPAATACGVIGLRRGDPLGKQAAIAGVVGMVVGIALTALLVGSDADALPPLR